MEPNVPRRGRRTWTWVALGAALLAAGAIVTFVVAQPVQVLPLMEPAPVFELADAAGGTFRSHERQGRISIYLFGASRDRERVEGLLGLIRETAGKLAAQGWLDSRAELVLISLDPEHDTPQVLAGLARSAALAGESRPGAGPGKAGLLPGLHLLTGSPVAVKLAVGSGFGIYYEPPVMRDGELRFVHEPAVVVVDGGGTVRGRYSAAAIGPDILLRDVGLLVEEADADGASRLLFAGAHLFLCYVP